MSIHADDPARETDEMILLTLARAEENGMRLTHDDLARELPSGSTANLQSLISQSLITPHAGALALTEAGRARAHALLRRHRLVERHATDVLGLDWTHAHERADQLEHTVSADEEAALSAQLGNPETCPHGNPIPAALADAAAAPLVSLARCATHTRGVIARISTETPDALRHLATLGLLPNVAVVVENQAPFGGPVLVRVGRSHYALGRALAARIWIKPETA